jgi:uncharacterized Fe-S cluster protein YjdI
MSIACHFLYKHGFSNQNLFNKTNHFLAESFCEHAGGCLRGRSKYCALPTIYAQADEAKRRKSLRCAEVRRESRHPGVLCAARL